MKPTKSTLAAFQPFVSIELANRVRRFGKALVNNKIYGRHCIIVFEGLSVSGYEIFYTDTCREYRTHTLKLYPYSKTGQSLLS